ncbi:MAG: hypothetical protein LUH12_06680 [Bacteroides sp.]|nr:hypothetical protein [Bacteroides sp.]
MRIFKSLLVWCCFIPAAILNGGLRQYVLVGCLGTYLALVVSGILLSLFILLITWLLLPHIGKLTRKESLQIGLLWMLLTIGFECIFGLAEGISFSELLSAYNPLTGNLWLLVVMTTCLAPTLACKRRFHNQVEN